MAGKYENLRFFEVALDSSTGGNEGTFIIPYRCRVYRAQIIVTTTEATACVVKYDLQPVAGSAAGRGDGDIAEITFPASDQQGKCYYDLAARGTILNEGDAVVAEVTTASTATKSLICQLIVDYIPEVEGNNTAMTLTA